MNRSSTPSRHIVMCGLVVLTLVTVTGCGPADSAPESSAEPAGWAILTSEAGIETLSLDIEGGSETKGDALILDGVTGSASTTAPEGFELTESFTVAAWVSATDAVGPSRPSSRTSETPPPASSSVSPKACPRSA